MCRSSHHPAERAHQRFRSGRSARQAGEYRAGLRWQQSELAFLFLGFVLNLALQIAAETRVAGISWSDTGATESQGCASCSAIRHRCYPVKIIESNRDCFTPGSPRKKASTQEGEPWSCAFRSVAAAFFLSARFPAAQKLTNGLIWNSRGTHRWGISPATFFGDNLPSMVRSGRSGAARIIMSRSLPSTAFFAGRGIP